MKHLDEGQLQAWLDRPRSGLGPREAGEIERHLRECEECARRLAELSDLDARADSILSSVEPSDASVPPFSEVEERSGRGGRERRPRRGLVALAWAASLVGALGVGWLTNELSRGERVAVESGPSEPAAEAARTDRAAPTIAATSDTSTTSDTAATETRVVRGRVTDEEGEPLASAQVVAADGEAGSLTEEDGTFSLEVPEALASSDSGISVTAQRIGYDAATQRIAPEEGDTVSANLQLPERAVALEEMTVEAAPSMRTGREAREDREASGAWRSVSRAAAEEEVGFNVVTVPGLEVLAVEVGELEGAQAVRVRQAVGPTTVLTMVQRRAEGATEAEDQADGMSTVSVRRGELLVTATAPMAVDSLRELVGRVR